MAHFRLSILIAFLLSAVSSWAQTPDTGKPRCVEQGDGKTWGSCVDDEKPSGGSSGSEGHCTLFHPCHNDHTSPGLKTEHPGDLNESNLHRVDPRTYLPQYQDIFPAEMYRSHHEDNKAGNPLPWDKSAGKYADIEAQAILDRYPLPPGMEDWKLYQDWADHLSKYSINVYYSWEDPTLAHQTVQDLNKDVIKEVSRILMQQLKRLKRSEPFYWDTPETQQLKRVVASERLHFLNNIMSDNESAQPRISEMAHPIGHPEVPFGFGVDIKGPLKDLIHISETGSWDSLRPEPGYEEYCFCQ